jgi:probable HAF family extracellular repeat protein
MTTRHTPTGAGLLCGSLLAFGIALAGCGGELDTGELALQRYRIVLPELAPPGEQVTSSVAFAINDRDDIVGTVETAAGRHAYRSSAQQAGPLTDFLPGGTEGIAFNLNNHGMVVGSVKVGDHRQAFTWMDGTASALPGLDHANPYGEAYGVNDAGDVVGAAGSADAPLAVVWRDRQVRRLRLLDPASPVSEAYGINESQVIVGGSGNGAGYTAVMWTHPDTVLNLGSLPGAREARGVALAVSNANHVTGVTSSRTGPHAFLWHDGVMHDLGDLPGGGDHSIGYGVNKHGHVVGTSQVKPGSGTSQSSTEAALLHHPFIWTPATGMVDLNSLIAPDDPLKDKVELLECAVITDDGKITGRAMVDGVIRAYVLIPLKDRS